MTLKINRNEGRKAFVSAPLVSVILPAYNEAHHIVANCIETIDCFLEMGIDFEIIIVDDGSHDRTDLEAARLFEHAHGHRLRVVRYDVNQGKGNAIMCGARYTRGDLVLVLDADLDLHPRQVSRFFEIMKRREADIVIGSKMHPDSVVNYPARRRLFSIAYYSLVRLLFGLPVRDTQTGIKLYKREVLERVFPRIIVKRFAFDIEVLANAHRLGFKIAEAPITLDFKKTFDRMRIRDVRSMIQDTLAIFYRMRIIRYYDRSGKRSFRQIVPLESERELRPADALRS